MTLKNIVVGSVITILYGIAVTYGICMLIDPARTQEWLARYWWRLPPGSIVPESLDSELLRHSSKRRVQARFGAVFLLGFLFLLAALFCGPLWRSK